LHGLPLDQQQIVQQLQVIFDCLYQKLQPGALLEHADGIVGESAYHDIELDAEERNELQLKQRECQAAHAAELADSHQQQRRQAGLQRKHGSGAAGVLLLPDQSLTKWGPVPNDFMKRKRTRMASSDTGTTGPAAFAGVGATLAAATAAATAAAGNVLAPGMAVDVTPCSPTCGSGGSRGGPTSGGLQQQHEQQQQQQDTALLASLNDSSDGGAYKVLRRSSSGRYRTTHALQEMSQDQQQAFVVEVAALLRAATSQQMRGMQQNLETFLNTCKLEHHNVGRLLGSFATALGFFMSHQEVFEVREVGPEYHPRWDATHWEAGRKSPGSDTMTRERKLSVGLVQDAGEYLLWGTERGHKLGGHLREQVVQVLQGRGLWQEAGATVVSQGIGLSVEDVMRMIPEDMQHYVQVRSNLCRNLRLHTKSLHNCLGPGSLKR
jgi:hypothetical protein